MTILVAKPFTVPQSIASHHGVTQNDGWSLLALQKGKRGRPLIRTYILRDGPNTTIAGSYAASMLGLSNHKVCKLHLTSDGKPESHTLTTKVRFGQAKFIHPTLVIASWEDICAAFDCQIDPSGDLVMDAWNRMNCFMR